MTYYTNPDYFSERGIDEKDALEVWTALVCVTEADSFMFKNMEAWHGDDFEHKVTDEQIDSIARMTNLVAWYVRDLILDTCCEYQDLTGHHSAEV